MIRITNPARLLAAPPLWPFAPEMFTESELCLFGNLPRGFSLPAVHHPTDAATLARLVAAFPDLIDAIPCPNIEGGFDLWVSATRHTHRLFLQHLLRTLPESHPATTRTRAMVRYLDQKVAEEVPA